MRISVVSKDKYLLRIFDIRLSDKAITVMEFDKNADVIVHDLDTVEALPETDAKILRVSRKDTPDALKLPLPPSFFEELVSQPSTKPLIFLSSDGKHVTVRERTVKLTSHEYSLLSLLISGNGNYTSREEIANKVWDGASDSLVNVYIHYLREKLETDGEKIIISSRKYGYKINPVYIKPQSDITEESEKKGDKA